ncbi:hypothetical protein, partial [Shigella sp. FC1967]|uniref:hypothetical protein n=1 Tax=Shigella sp. FC1967 TaxID=1898041 RepID=UPI00112A16E8
MISIFTKLGLNENEINILGEKRLLNYKAVLPNIESIKDISEFHRFHLDKINNKDELVNLFGSNKTSSILSKVYEVSDEVIEQIISLLKLDDEIKFDNIKEISSYIDMIKTFNITPDNFNLLTQLKFTTSESKEKDYL